MSRVEATEIAVQRVPHEAGELHRHRLVKAEPLVRRGDHLVGGAPVQHNADRVARHQRGAEAPRAHGAQPDTRKAKG